MQIEIVSFSDAQGGAARAAYRLHRGFRQASEKSSMRVRCKLTDDPSVIGPVGKLAKMVNTFRSPIGQLILQTQRSLNTNYRSANWLPSRWSDVINGSAASVINLHWVGGETLSIGEIGRITKPLVWTLHDMWAFSGAEHVSDYEGAPRWANGYRRDNRSAGDTGLDIDRWVWRRKKAAWRKPIRLVAPSQWLAQCVRRSALMADWPVTVIPNALDTNVFKPLDQAFCRHILDLPAGKTILAFGALGAATDANKGLAELFAAFGTLVGDGDRDDYFGVIFGADQPARDPGIPFQSRWLGKIHDDVTLALIYGAADVVIATSRIENLPQVCTEAQSCGTPVVAWHRAGFPDAVEHLATGYLALPFDATDLAHGIRWTLQANADRSLSHAARDRAVALWSTQLIVQRYLAEYRLAVEQHDRS